MSERTIRGWLWQGTTKWWPAIWGDPPQIRGVRWVPIYDAAKSENQA